MPMLGRLRLPKSLGIGLMGGGGSQFPRYISGEIGAVDASTVAITFSMEVSALDYAAGVTVKNGGVSQTITNATRQADKRVVYFALDTPAVFGQALTWEYSAAGGSYASLDGTKLMGDVAPQAAKNNILPLLDFSNLYNSMYATTL